MTIRTRIEVDVTGLSAQIDAIKNKLGELTTSARGGEYKLNTQQAERDVGHLLRQLDKLEVLRDNAARHDELLPGQSQDMARVYRQAANAVNRVNRQSGTDEPVDWLRTAADEQAQAAEAAEPGHGTRQRRQSQYKLIADGADQPFSPVPPTPDKPGEPSDHIEDERTSAAPTSTHVESGQPPTLSPVEEQLDESRKRVAHVQNAANSYGDFRFYRMDNGFKSDNQQAQRGIDELAAQYDALEKAKKRQGDLSIEQAKRLAAIYRDIAKTIDAINKNHGLTQTAAEPIRKAATEAQAEANRLALNPAQGQQPPDQHGNNSRLNLLARGAGVIAGAAIGGGGAGSAIGSLLGSRLPGPWSLAGSAVGGAIGGQIDKGLSGAETEAISYHDLRNQLGNAAVDFDGLRDGVRKLTEGLGVGYNETVKLAQQFTRTAAATPDAAKLGRDLQDAIGFGRSYGVEPSAAVDFFAQQRLTGVTTGEADNKRLAVQIAEAIGRGGGNAKMTEMLSVITNFTQKTAYDSLITPDVSRFTSLIGTMMNSGTPGLAGNPANAANLLGQANAGFAGSGGDVQDMFMMLALQRTNQNFTGFDLPIARSAGLLASPSQYLGRDSQPYQLAEAYHDWQTLGRYNKLSQSTDKNLAMIIKEGERESVRSDGSVDTNLLSHYVQGQTKLDISQAKALILSYQQNKGFGDLETRLKDFGLDEKNLGNQKLGAITPLLLSQGSGAYIEQYQQLQANNKVTRTDRERIAAIKDTGSKEFKQEVLKLVMDNATDEGDKLLKVNTNMADNLQKLAADLIPATLVIKQGILEVVRWVAKLSGNDNAKAFVASEDLKAMGERYGIDISGKNGNDQPLIDKDAALQKFLNFEKNYAQDLPGWKDDAYKMLHNAGEDFNQLQADYQANQGAFPKETPQLLEKMRKYAGLDHSVPTEHNGQYYALPLAGLNAAGEAIRDNSKSDNIIQRLLPRQYKGRPFIAPQDLRKYKEDYANNKTEYDTAVGGFLDRLTPLVEKAPVDEKTGYRLVDQEAVYGLLEKKPQAEDFRQPIAPPTEPPPVYAPSESQPSRLPASGKGLSDPPAQGRGLTEAQLSEAFNHPHTIANPTAWLGRADTLPSGADIRDSRGYQRLKPNQRRVADKIAAESAKQSHPELANFITATALSESSLRQSAAAQSNSGEAKGVFQFIPGTAKKRGVNQYDEDDNIRGGVELFIDNLKKFNSIDKAIAAHLTGLDYTDRELKPGGSEDPLGTNGMEKAAAVERLALAFTPEHPYREKPPLATGINVTGTPEPVQKQAAMKSYTPLHSNEDERNQQLYRELYPEQVGNGNTPPAPSINVTGAPEKTTNDSGVILHPYREKPPLATGINVTGAPEPVQKQAAMKSYTPLHSNEDERNQQLYRELYPEQVGNGNTPLATGINVTGTPEKTTNDSGVILHPYREKPPLATDITIPWTANKAGKAAPKINTGKTMSTKAAPIITGKPDKSTINTPLSWAMDNKIKNQDRPDKIPDNLFAAVQKEAEKTMRFRFNPLAVNIALTDRLGNPMADNIISSSFGLPRPSGTS